MYVKSFNFQILKDELMELQMLYTKAEEKLRELDIENKILIERFMNLKVKVFKLVQKIGISVSISERGC